MPNPFNWSSNVKSLSAVVTLIVTILGSAWGATNYIGGKIYDFAAIQTRIVQQLNTMAAQILDTKSAITAEDTKREKGFEGIKSELNPRIDHLETAVHSAETEASAAKQRADDMKEQINRLTDLAQRTLNITSSHDADIKATRRAVAPKTGDLPQ